MHTPARTCIRQAENPVISMIKELSKSRDTLTCDASEIITDSPKYVELLKDELLVKISYRLDKYY